MNSFCAFDGMTCIGRGSLHEVASSIHAYLTNHPQAQLLIFNGQGRQIDLDMRGTLPDILSRLPAPTDGTAEPEEPAAAPATPRAGRPRLGVIAREVTLLPRHWDWLASQSGGASVSLRKLVEKAMRDNRQTDRANQARDAACRFMQAMAGNLVGFEEANRALYAGSRTRFVEQTAGWPEDIRQHALTLAEESWAAAGSQPG